VDLAALERQFRGQGETVVERLEHWASATPGKRCLFYGEDNITLSYDGFNRLCNRAANGLASLGIRHGDRVSVVSHNALVSLLSMFGLWKLGAVYCPINYNCKGDLLAYLINDTKPAAIILDQIALARLAEVIPLLACRPKLVVHRPRPGEHDHMDDKLDLPSGLDSLLLAELLEAPAGNPGTALRGADLANIIYTSGTTGMPKGVVHTHDWIHGAVYSGILQQHPDDVTYTDMPMYHVAASCQTVGRVVWGGAEVAVWDRFSPAGFWDRIALSGANGTSLIGVMADWLMRQPPSERDRRNGLRVVGIVPLPANHNEIARRFGFDFVGGGYGSTEVGSAFSFAIDELGDEEGVPPDLAKGYSKDQYREAVRTGFSPGAILSADEPIGKGMIGAPGALIEVGVVNEAGEQLPPGQPGFAAFRPRLPGLLFKEYFNKPEATAKAVVDGWFRPADMISYDAEGKYYFEDRMEGFIRVRGENLSASTVEEVLAQHPAVGSCAVIGVPAREGSEEDVAAFVVAKPDSHLDLIQLRAWAAEKLPKFMVPRHVRIVAELPVTPTFKVQRFVLKEQLLRELEQDAAASQPG
jgi:crotonobetaine/carnitine-CoA ligase